MKNSINFLKNNSDFIDRFLIIFIFFIPFSLSISIFLADFLTSVTGLIMLYIFFIKKNVESLKSIKKEIIFFLFLYLLIFISLILSKYKDYSFLASFFYFRYFLLSLAIFYLLKKYKQFSIILCKSLLFTFLVIIGDSFFQYFLGYNILGYKQLCCAGELNHITSFFGAEKKLGSYLVRLLPLILSLIYFTKFKHSNKIELLILVSVGWIVFFTSERTALFLLIMIYGFYFLLSKEKILFSVSIIVIFVFLFNFNKDFKGKIIDGTIKQSQVNLFFENSPRPVYQDIPRLFSYEHENLFFTGIKIFKNNPFFGSGVKTFYKSCADLQPKFQFKLDERNNRLVCSTHPHNTYAQILSEIGIFGFLLIFFLFIKILFLNLKIILKKNKNNLDKSFFFINLTFIINLMPLIPSGSFFNNWMSLIMFFPIGFWLYINDSYIKNK